MTAYIEHVSRFDPGGDDAAAKSKELTLGLLRNTLAPFSRRQFTPGHITGTALVLHPVDDRVLFMHHHRLLRWLLPGGHVEKSDADPAETAAREAEEETGVILRFSGDFMAGIDVHGIPAKKTEPYHLHHDLIWCFRAESDEIKETDEATEVRWAGESDWARLDIAPAIRQSIRRALAHG